MAHKAVSEERDALQKKLEQQERINTERNRLDRRAKDLEEEVRAKNKHVQVKIPISRSFLVPASSDIYVYIGVGVGFFFVIANA